MKKAKTPDPITIYKTRQDNLQKLTQLCHAPRRECETDFFMKMLGEKLKRIKSQQRVDDLQEDMLRLVNQVIKEEAAATTDTASDSGTGGSTNYLQLIEFSE